MEEKRILIVEDNEDNRQVLIYRLRKIRPFDIVEATNGVEALDALRRMTPDLILMDLRMPGMDGWEATRRIRSLDGTSGRIPIVAVTAQAMSADRQRALDAGCDDFLAKPIVDPLLLRITVERYVGVSQ